MLTNELLHALHCLVSVIQSLILILIIIDFPFHYYNYLSIMKINKFFQLFFLDIDNFILIGF